ncbi:ATP-binding protein [Candidatus Chlorohelix sp.]|uniref:sensor histidine kinase n=1 Tax=Candidatus Chlorohelix sp. TaxID=3139201 RepID=UPI0030690EB9
MLEHINEVSSDSQNKKDGTQAFNRLNMVPAEELFVPEISIRPEQAEALLVISSMLNSELNPGNVLINLVQHVSGLFKASRAAVFLRKNLQHELVDSSNLHNVFTEEEPLAEIGMLVCAANWGLPEEFIDKIAKFCEFNRLQNVRSPLYIEDIQAEQCLNGLRELSMREGLITMLTLPLLYRQNLIGIMVLYHNHHKIYSREDLRLLTIITNQAALAITNSRLYEEARRREQEAEMLAEISRILSTSLKLREVLHIVGEMSAKMAGNTSVIFIVRENTDQIFPINYYSKEKPPPELPEYTPVKNSTPVRIGQTVVGKVVQNATSMFIKDNTDWSRIAPFIRDVEHVNSLLCVPLKVRSKVIGALAIYNITYGNPEIKITPIEDRHVALLQQLAERAANAIENARNYGAERLALREKDQFLDFLSHELRTPLTSLIGYNSIVNKLLKKEILGKTDLNKLIESLLQNNGAMGSQLERLQTLMEDITNISNIDANKLELHKHTVDLIPLIRNKINEAEQLAKKVRMPYLVHRFELRTNPAVVISDVDIPAFERVIASLLSNAVKYSPQGGLIRVKVQQALEEITISIQDEGVGIPEKDLFQLFERFFKADNSPSKAKGLGLGLYLSQNFIKAMGGHIEVQSEEGKGSNFIIYLRASTPLKSNY